MINWGVQVSLNQITADPEVLLMSFSLLSDVFLPSFFLNQKLIRPFLFKSNLHDGSFLVLFRYPDNTLLDVVGLNSFYPNISIIQSFLESHLTSIHISRIEILFVSYHSYYKYIDGLSGLHHKRFKLQTSLDDIKHKSMLPSYNFIRKIFMTKRERNRILMSRSHYFLNAEIGYWNLSYLDVEPFCYEFVELIFNEIK